jgi:hypothetical protein
MRILSSWLGAVALVLTFGGGTALAQPALPLGTMTKATTTDDAPAEFTFKAEGPGVLTVVVQGDGDLVIEVIDEDRQPVPDGTADRDLYGSTGNELLAVTLGEAGAYLIRVRIQMGGTKSTFQMVAGWLPFPPFARPGDPDRRPAQARAIAVGESVEDSLDASEGDLWDWFVLTPESAGTLVIVTRPAGDDVDLVLEAYIDGDFTSPAARSDQDLQGDTASESVSVNVTAGQAVHVRVSGAFSQPQGRYRLSSTLMP